MDTKNSIDIISNYSQSVVKINIEPYFQKQNEWTFSLKGRRVGREEERRCKARYWSLCWRWFAAELEGIISKIKIEKNIEEKKRVEESEKLDEGGGIKDRRRLWVGPWSWDWECKRSWEVEVGIVRDCRRPWERQRSWRDGWRRSKQWWGWGWCGGCQGGQTLQERWGHDAGGVVDHGNVKVGVDADPRVVEADFIKRQTLQGGENWCFGCDDCVQINLFIDPH